MAEIKCLDCGTIVPEDAPNCPECGRIMANKRSDENRRGDEDRRQDSNEAEVDDHADRRNDDRRKKKDDRRGFSY